MYVYPSPLSFKKAFIILVPKNGTAMSSTGGTESLLLQGLRLVAAAADLGGSRVDGRTLCLTLEVVPGSSLRIFAPHTAGALSCLNNYLRKGKGEHHQTSPLILSTLTWQDQSGSLTISCL